MTPRFNLDSPPPPRRGSDVARPRPAQADRTGPASAIPSVAVFFWFLVECTPSHRLNPRRT